MNLNRFAVFSGVLAALVCTAALPAHADDYSYKRTIDFAVPAAGASSVTITGYNGNIRLFAENGAMVRIHAVVGARSTDSLRALDVRTSRQGNVVLIEDVCPSTRSFIFWQFKDCDVELDVHYPRTLFVNVRNENGNIAGTGAGNGIGVVNANGNITLDEPGGPVSVTNTNGNVRIEQAPANVTVSNKQGNVHVDLASNWHGSEIGMHTRAGNVVLSVPRGFAATYVTKVTLGQVSKHGELAAGPAKVTATTTFGNVVISQQ